MFINIHEHINDNLHLLYINKRKINPHLLRFCNEIRSNKTSDNTCVRVVIIARVNILSESLSLRNFKNENRLFS